MSSRTELAKQATAAGRAITEGGIRQAIRSGRVRPDVSNLSDLLDDLANNTTFKNGGDTTGGKPSAQASPYAGQAPRGRVSSDGMTLMDVNLQIAKIKAADAALDYKVKELTLADTDGMRKASQLAGRMVREAIESIPSKIAAQVAAETDVLKVTTILENAIRDALKAVADKLV